MFRWGEFTQNGGDICTKVWHSKVEKTSHGTMKVSTLGVNFQCEYFNIILGRIATDVGDKFKLPEYFVAAEFHVKRESWGNINGKE